MKRALSTPETPSPFSKGRRTGGDGEVYVRSQEHLLTFTPANNQPNMVPPPTPTMMGAMGARHVVCFIGLPCRGKPFIAKRLQQFLSFYHGADCLLMDVKDNSDEEKMSHEIHSFLDGSNEAAARNMSSSVASTDIRSKHVDSGKIVLLYTSGVLDSEQSGYCSVAQQWSGSTKTQRWWMSRQLSEKHPELKVKLIFVECIVDDEELLKSLVMKKVRKNLGPTADQAAVTTEYAKLHGWINIVNRMYVSLQDDQSESDLSYIKLWNFGQRLTANRISGYLPMTILKFLSVVHPRTRTVYITRHGQSEYNQQKKIGGNSQLTSAGKQYAANLARFSAEQICKGSAGEDLNSRLWTSSLRRTIETASQIAHPVVNESWVQMDPRVYRAIDEIYAGDYEGMTYKEIEEKASREAKMRKVDKLGYRYPRGESYLDMITRLEPVMQELESYEEPLLMVSHQALLRLVYAYLKGLDRKSALQIEIPLHTVIKMTWGGWQEPSEERFYLGPELETKDDGQKNL